jgi:hypothetical protein
MKAEKAVKAVIGFVSRKLAPFVEKLQQIETKLDCVANENAGSITALSDLLAEVSAREPIQGKEGPQGPAGPQGERGEPGPIGPQGEKGADGLEGPIGPIGAAGPRGEKGDPGLQGKEGAPGPEGPMGPSGRDGSDGREGAPGANGKDGESAEVTEEQIQEWKAAVYKQVWESISQPMAEAVQKAVQEAVQAIPPPKDGNDGLPGPIGPQGLAGASAYEIAKALGYEGTEREWLASFKGERGPEGAAGAAGRDGVNGQPGGPGPAGKDGADGESAYAIAVRKGFLGTEEEWIDSLRIEGRDGRDGREGKEGAPGRDALALEPLPNIDFEQSYPRGTWARHRNGLFYAAMQTEGEKGWECGVDGVFKSEFEKIDDRNYISRTIYSSGMKTEYTFSIPLPIHKGERYESERDYQQGDCVTWAGSVWMALTDLKGVQPNTNPDSWRLIVKRGSDGKPGVPGLSTRSQVRSDK